MWAMQKQSRNSPAFIHGLYIHQRGLGTYPTGLPDFCPSTDFCLGTLCLLESLLPLSNPYQIILAQSMDSSPQIRLLAALVGLQPDDLQIFLAYPAASCCKSQVLPFRSGPTVVFQRRLSASA